MPFSLTSSRLLPYLWKKVLKTENKLKEQEIMYRYATYICISWYSKICWFPVKKCWCEQNSTGMSSEWCIFWIFFSQVITVPNFIIAGYMWQIIGKGGLLWGLSIHEQPRKGPSWIGLKRDCSTCVFLSLLRNFYRTAFLQSSFWCLLLYLGQLLSDKQGNKKERRNYICRFVLNWCLLKLM